MKNGNSVKTAFDEAIEKLAEGIHAFPWKDANAYGCWLAQSYYLVRHSTTLLTIMASKLGPEREREHSAVLGHLREETGHEKMALKDLKTLGGKPEDFGELLETRLIYQTQYYWLDRRGPSALPGYALMLEGLSIMEGPKVLDTVEAAHGKRCCLFLEVHVRDDVKHFHEGVERLSALPEEEIRSALENLSQSTRLYLNMLDSIQRHVARKGGNLRLVKTERKVA